MPPRNRTAAATMRRRAWKRGSLARTAEANLGSSASDRSICSNSRCSCPESGPALLPVVEGRPDGSDTPSQPAGCVGDRSQALDSYTDQPDPIPGVEHLIERPSVGEDLPADVGRAAESARPVQCPKVGKPYLKGDRPTGLPGAAQPPARGAGQGQ